MECSKAQEELRTQLLQEAREAARGLESDASVLAAILTGSAAWGKPNPNGDIDILLITQGRPGVCYRYLVPRFCNVRRRTELGFIPYETAVRNIEKGYGTLLSCSLIEQLKNGRVLFQKGTSGDDLVAACRNVSPNLVTVGTMIDELAESVRSTDESLGRARFDEATLTARHAARLAVRALLLARDRVGVSKEKHEYRAVRSRLTEREAASYEKIMGVEGLSPATARRILDQTIAIMKWTLERFLLAPSVVSYERRKGTTGPAA